MYLLLAGGVGGAKLAEGLASVLRPEELAVVVNTGDDTELHGLYISPDLDTVMYTLAGIVDRQQGWGIAGDSVACLEMLATYGQDTWFRLGDRDLATHIVRTSMLRAGKTLTEVTDFLRSRLGVGPRIIPMSDEPVRTQVVTPEGELAFQDFFVRRRAKVQVSSLRWEGVEQARPSPAFLEALDQAEALIIAPSNPLLSIEPILRVGGIRDRIRSLAVPRVAVSPIVAGQAIKGPLARMMQDLGLPVSALGVAGLYRGLIDVFFIDRADAPLAKEIEALGIQVVADDIMMNDRRDKERVAERVLAAVRDAALRRNSRG